MMISTRCAALVSLICCSASACMYDWTVPAATGNGGAGGDSATVTSAGGSTSVGGAQNSGVGGNVGGQGGDGGSGGVVDECTPQVGDDPCIECVKTGCCTELKNCTGDTQCECLIGCYENPMSGCLAGCGQPPNGSPGFLLGQCAISSVCTACIL
jgi:hypothetical protein